MSFIQVLTEIIALLKGSGISIGQIISIVEGIIAIFNRHNVAVSAEASNTLNGILLAAKYSQGK